MVDTNFTNESDQGVVFQCPLFGHGAARGGVRQPSRSSFVFIGVYSWLNRLVPNKLVNPKR